MPGLPRLYLITDRRLVPGGDLAAALVGPLAAGVRLVQLREKDLPARDLAALARAVKARTDAAGAALLVNDRADVALAVGTGVHLTSADPPVAEARALMGPNSLVGVSCHTVAEAVAAARAGASLVTLGPVYDTPSKRGLGTPIGTAPLAEAARAADVPVYALGGVGPDVIGAVVASGCHGVAVIRAVLGAPDPGAAAARLLEALGRSRKGAQSR